MFMKEKYDVIEAADRAGQYRVFLQALDAAGLKKTLKETGRYTILAPVDDAFLKIPQSRLNELFRMENRETLQLLLRNHIINGELSSKELKRRDETRSVKGDLLRIESRTELWVNDARVVNPDLKGTNGVLHGIDTVLIPQAQTVSAG